ncbi:MAG: insulinase family protein [Thermodesulfovibrionales bacterium]|nr:insulinase family protein [Thermodesulfovibrionales bacterium]
MLRTLFITLLTCLALMAVSPATALGPEVTEHELDNGLKVLLAEDHSSPLVIFQIWYRVGARDEISGRSGISHLLEHMMFKGTKRHGTKVLSRTVNRNGGMDNAFTSKDSTAYFQILPSDRLEISLKFEPDRMKNLLIKEEDVLAERLVVMEERRLRYVDNPQNALFELVSATAFTSHPYRRPIIGWMEDLRSIEREDLLAHYRAYYSPDNAVVVVVGDFNSGDLLKEIKKKFGKLKPLPRPRSHVSAEPGQKGQRRVMLKRTETRLPYVIAAYHVPGFPHEDSYALEALAELLSGGKSSRLYRALVREKRLALSAYAEYAGMYKDPYLFFLGATASAKASDNSGAEALEQSLYEEVERIASKPPGERELQKVKNSLEADYIMGLDSLYMQAMTIGMSEMLGDWRLRDQYVQRIRAVSAEDVSRVAKKYLTQDNRTVGVLTPENKEEGK